MWSTLRDPIKCVTDYKVVGVLIGHTFHLGIITDLAYQTWSSSEHSQHSHNSQSEKQGAEINKWHFLPLKRPKHMGFWLECPPVLSWSICPANMSHSDSRLGFRGKTKQNLVEVAVLKYCIIQTAPSSLHKPEVINALIFFPCLYSLEMKCLYKHIINER